MTLILGRKKGMTQYFAEDGTVIGCTVLEAGPCTVMQIRTPERDGYHAVQWGFEDVKERRAAKPQRVQAASIGVAPKRFLREERLCDASGKNVGDTITAEAFNAGDIVDVVGTTKGRGFAGTIKRHGFGRGPKTHGSMNYRRPGSIGCSAYPSRVFKGKRMSGHYGAKRHTIKNLEVVRIDAERGLIFVRGAVPGHRGSFVQIRTARTGVKKG
ncbi:MAG: 50S ribosomal protein L3 [Planctomycetota bacterium]